MRRWMISIRLPGGEAHKAAAYMLAMLLWRANRGAEDDLRAKDLLAEAADDDPMLTGWNDLGIVRPHKHISRR